MQPQRPQPVERPPSAPARNLPREGAAESAPAAATGEVHPRSDLRSVITRSQSCQRFADQTPSKADGVFEGLQEGSSHSSLKPSEVVITPSVPGADLTSPALHSRSPAREQPRVGPNKLRSVGSTSQGSCNVQGSRVCVGAEGAETTRATIRPPKSQEAAPKSLHSQQEEVLHHHCAAAAVAEIDGDGQPTPGPTRRMIPRFIT